MRKTFKYRLYPTAEQERILDTWLMLSRRLYNACLEQRIAAWEKRKNVNYYDQANELPDLKRCLPEYAVLDAQMLQDVVHRIDKAFQSFFRRCRQGADEKGFPKFQGRNRYDSVTFKQTSWKLADGRLHLRNCGAIKVKWSRPLEGDIKQVTVRRTKTGKWFVCFSCDNVPASVWPEPVQEAIGIDLGLAAFVTTSGGDKLGDIRFLRRKLRHLRRVQRHASRCKKGSNRQHKAYQHVARIHEGVANQRRDMQHKVSTTLVRENAVIALEGDKRKDGTFKPISPRFMLANKHMALSANDAGWYGFTTMLLSKAATAGRIVQLVDKSGTSQFCSRCGVKVPKGLHVRVHDCPHCGLVLDRDHNAAINILARTGPSGAKPRVA